MCEEIEPGLEGFSDSGSDFYDLPAPELPRGIHRTVVREASGVILKRPQAGDEVEVHYVRRCVEDARVFDSTQPLRFALGKGQVCEALDLAVATMRLGEISKFRISPAFSSYAAVAASVANGTPDTSLEYEIELLDWVSCTDLFEDGSVLKRLLVRATDKRRPVLGQECLLRCRLTLAEDSSAALADFPALEFSISRGRPPPTLAGGGSISSKLLDAAVLSMRRGERASVQCAAGVALADLPAGLERESQVVCELELLEFLDITDVSFEKDGTVMKRSLRCRDAWTKCQDAGRCSLRVAFVKHGDAVLCRDQLLEFTLGDGEVCDALECAVACMREGEEAEVTCCLASMCEEPRLGVHGCVGLVFHLELSAYAEGPSEQARRDGEKIELYSARKDAAVALFKAGRIRLAAFHFRRVYEQLGYVDDYRNNRSTEARKAQVAELKKVCLLNRALCTLKDGNFKAAVAACDFILDEESHNCKALFRRARAYMGLGNLVQAQHDAKAAMVMEPKSMDIRKLLAEIKAQQKLHDGAVKSTYTKMCEGLGSLPHPLDVD